MYRCPTQPRAIYAVLAARDPVTQLVVLPTAGRQTATFLIPADCEATAALSAASAGGCSGGRGDDAETSWFPPVTIVLTPNRAITANTIAAAHRVGVTVGSWPLG